MRASRPAQNTFTCRRSRRANRVCPPMPSQQGAGRADRAVRRSGAGLDHSAPARGLWPRRPRDPAFLQGGQVYGSRLMPGSPRNRTSLIHVLDLARALGLALAEPALKHRTIEVHDGAPLGYTMREIIGMIAAPDQPPLMAARPQADPPGVGRHHLAGEPSVGAGAHADAIQGAGNLPSRLDLHRPRPLRRGGLEALGRRPEGPRGDPSLVRSREVALGRVDMRAVRSTSSQGWVPSRPVL